MSEEPLRITFVRSGGGLPSLRFVMPDATLSPDDEHAWMGTEPPPSSLRGAGDADTVRFRVEFRRGGERRVVELGEHDRTAHLAPLLDDLVRRAEAESV